MIKFKYKLKFNSTILKINLKLNNSYDFVARKVYCMKIIK